MPKTIISEQQIILALQSLVDHGESPTIAVVSKKLDYLEVISTIHKYLYKWQQQCFQLMYDEKRRVKK